MFVLFDQGDIFHLNLYHINETNNKQTKKKEKNLNIVMTMHSLLFAENAKGKSLGYVTEGVGTSSH